jgi:hypothetical protein
MKEQIKELRVKIDGLAQLTEELKPLRFSEKELQSMNMPSNWAANNSKEIEQAVDSLYLAKAWLGKVLQELGTESPYKSGYKTKEDIEPTADVAEYIPGDKAIADRNKKDYSEFNHIEKVDWLRTEIEKLITKFKETYKGSFDNPFFPNLRLSGNIEQHLSEARFWLGFELQRIKENT